MSLHTAIYNSQLNRGFAALIAIVVIGAAALIFAYNASLLGLGELESGYTSQQGSKAFSIAEGCMDEALRRLRISPSFTGTIILPVSGGGSCSVDITGVSPIVAVSTGCTVTGCASGYTKKVRAELTINIVNQINAITISRWEEIP